MSLRLASWVVLSALAGCGDSSEVGGQREPIHVSSSYTVPPTLQSVATYVRDANGWVFRGTVLTTPQAQAPELVQATGDLWVSYPIAHVDVAVSDAMGSGVSPTLQLRGRNGGPSVVDVMGAPSPGSTVSDDPAGPYRAVPASGEYVFFVLPHQGHAQLIWRAPVSNGSVSGVGTTEGADVPLSALRL